jgi:S1-C subfamily serine protease
MKINRLYGVILGSVCAMSFGLSALADHEKIASECYSADTLNKVDVHMGGFGCVVKKVKPGTVAILVRPKEQTTLSGQKIGGNPMVGGEEEGDGGIVGGASGSGFFITNDGYVVTNHHVVAQGDPKDMEYAVALVGEKQPVPATLVGSDEEADLAVLKADLKGKKIQHLHWADLKNMTEGDKVIAIGSPFGLDFTVTLGYISAFRGLRLDSEQQGSDVNVAAENSQVIQTDTAVNPGNSGGALLNVMGDVVGVNQAIFSTSRDQRSAQNGGVAFAISANYAKGVVSQIIEKGHVVRGWIGISMQPVQKGEEKLWKLEPGKHPYIKVRKIYSGEAADDSGLRVDDVILSVNGKEVTDANVLKLAVANGKVGSTVVFDVIHMKGAKKDSVKITIEDRANMSEKTKKEIAREQAELQKQMEQQRQGQRGMPPGMMPGDEEGPMMEDPRMMPPPGRQGQRPLPPGNPFEDGGEQFGFEQPAPKKQAPAQPKKQDPKAQKKSKGQK